MKYATELSSLNTGGQAASLQPLSPRTADFVLVPLLYYLGAKLGLLTGIPEGMAILSPASSVLLAALILFRGRGFALFGPSVIVAEIIADAPTFSLLEALLFGVVNVTEAYIAFLLLKRWHFNPRFTALGDLTKFVVAGPLIAALACAFLGAGIYAHFRGAETGYLEFVRIWWFGDGLGLLLFTPLSLSLWRTPWAGDRAPATWGSTDWIMSAAALGVIGLLAFARNGSFGGVHVGPEFLLPFAIYAAARLDFRWATLSTAMAALAISMLTTGGRNPFGNLTPHEAVIDAQAFIFLMSLMSLGLSALLSQLRAQQQVLQLTNRRLNELNGELERRVSERTTELAAVNAQLSRLAMTDALTGLLNRRAFCELAQRELEQHKRHHQPLAVLMLDIDHFKAINDSHGHQAGDQVLRQFVAIVKDIIRAGDVFARYGGEEFVILAPFTSLKDAVLLAHRIREALGAHGLRADQREIKVTASAGIAAVTYECSNLDTLLKHADDALYRAKASGRNRVECWAY